MKQERERASGGAHACAQVADGQLYRAPEVRSNSVHCKEPGLPGRTAQSNRSGRYVKRRVLSMESIPVPHFEITFNLGSEASITFLV